MTQGLLTAAYIIASILFILSLGGLSNQETARRGNIYGMIGMLIAVFATIWGSQVTSYEVLTVAMIIGAIIGTIVALKVEMTGMPQLVAMLHSFVGLAAVLVGFANYIHLAAATSPLVGAEKVIHEVEIYLGVLIGAVTFTGSVIAFGKLQGIVGSRPLLLPGRHFLNLSLGIACIWFGVEFINAENLEAGLIPLSIMTAIALIFGVHMVMAIGGADMNMPSAKPCASELHQPAGQHVAIFRLPRLQLVDFRYGRVAGRYQNGLFKEFPRPEARAGRQDRCGNKDGGDRQLGCHFTSPSQRLMKILKHPVGRGSTPSIPKNINRA